jgi:hypothetical protein
MFNERMQITKYHGGTMNAERPKVEIPEPPLKAMTLVVSHLDGEPGRVLNGYAYDGSAGGWTEYEVSTKYGIEIWKVEDLFVPDEQD